MSALSDKWRRRATEIDEALVPLLGATGVVPAVIQATKAAVLPELLNAMAEMLDAVKSTTPEGDIVANSISRSNKVKLAAIRGALEDDWNDFNKLVADLGFDSGTDAKS